MRRIFSIRRNRILAVAVAAAVALSGVAVGLGFTFAGKPNVVIAIEKPNNYDVVDVGGTFTQFFGGAVSCESSNVNKATCLMLRTSMITVHGVSAGIVSIAAASSGGGSAVATLQVRDTRNIASLEVKKGGEHLFSGPGTASNPKTVSGNSLIIADKAEDSITWRSLQPEVAAVVNEGSDKSLITAVGKGTAIILGEFTDIWGVAQSFHILVGVGVSLGGSGDPDNPNLSDLLDWINKGRDLLNLDPNPYTSDSLAELQTAVNDGETVLDATDPTDAAIKDAVDDIKDAFDDLEQKKTGGELLGPDAEGNYYRPVGDPANVYEVVNGDGTSMQPPTYIWNPAGDPVDQVELNEPVYPPTTGDPFWRVEDPEGSNIWKRVKSDGTLDDEDAVWGGPDGRPGGGDDLVVKEFGGSWWVSRGHNVWQAVDATNPMREDALGLPYGGGPDRDPSTEPVRVIFDNTISDGHYYVGPMGPDETGNYYYYGDPLSGSDGYLDSTEDGPEGDDILFYRDPNTGSMVTTPPDPLDPYPPQMLTATNVKISAGGSTFLIKDNGTLWGAGQNGEGELAQGDYIERRTSFVPIMSGTPYRFKMISGQSHIVGQVLALTTEGRVFSWGYNYYYQVGDGTTKTRNVPYEITVPGDLDARFSYVAVGENSSAAITTDGELYTWGLNNYGQLGVGDYSVRKTPTRVVVGTLETKVVTVSVGDDTMLALTEDGYIYAWGRNDKGQLATGNYVGRTSPALVVFDDPDIRIKELAARSYGHALALTTDGDLYVWGCNNYGQLGDGTTTTRNRPVLLISRTAMDIETVVSGHDNSWLITTDGDLYGWGYGGSGTLGLGSTSDKKTPQFVMGDTMAVAASENTTMAVTTDGKLHIWGSNYCGQYGNGTRHNPFYVPTFVPLS